MLYSTALLMMATRTRAATMRDDERGERANQMKARRRSDAQDREASASGIVPVLFILAVWCLQFGYVTAQQVLMGETDSARYLLPRLLTACVGMLISFGILKVHQRQDDRGICPMLSDLPELCKAIGP